MAGVWHLGETGTGAAGDYQDSSATGNNSTSTTLQPTAVAGPFHGAQDFTLAGGSAAHADRLQRRRGQQTAGHRWQSNR